MRISNAPFAQGPIAAFALLLFLLLGACATAPATGRTFFTGGIDEESEARIGAEQHPKMVESFGGAYEDAALQSYVESIGNLLVQTSELPEQGFTFTVLDTPMANAFALPGGYVYVTRGVLTLAENEAQLAGVLAHEIGHVTARHSAERYGSSLLATIATVGLGIIGGGEVAQLSGSVAQLALSSFSRDQEYEADLLGIRYLTRAGYDPAAMAGFLENLQAEARLQAALRDDPEAAERFSLLQTHPRTRDRVERAMAEAGVTPAPGAIRAQDIYYRKIDGLLYGDRPSEGFVRGRRFVHPELRFEFEVPPEFLLFNGRRQVVARGPGRTAILFDRARSTSSGRIVDYLTREWAGEVTLRDVEAIQVNGMPAATGWTRARSRSGDLDLRAVAIEAEPGIIYRFLFISDPRESESLSEAYRRTTYSFRRLSEAEAAAIRPYRLRIVEVAPGDSVESLAARLPFAERRVERFLVLNGLTAGDSLRPGDRVKLIVEDEAGAS
jgi:predicted Zn-dependent protease